jgi:hypothetical protein
MLGKLSLASLALLVACVAPPAEPPSPVPAAADTWSLSFEYMEGYRGDPIRWGVTIGSDGLCCAWWQRWRGPHWGEPFDPAPAMRARLREAVERAGLREMPGTLAGGADCDWLTLTLTDGTGVHRVTCGCAASLARQPMPADVGRRDAIRRCFLVVADVLRLQPSPIEGQTPESCEALARGE